MLLTSRNHRFHALLIKTRPISSLALPFLTGSPIFIQKRFAGGPGGPGANNIVKAGTNIAKNAQTASAASAVPVPAAPAGAGVTTSTVGNNTALPALSTTNNQNYTPQATPVSLSKPVPANIPIPLSTFGGILGGSKKGSLTQGHNSQVTQQTQQSTIVAQSKLDFENLIKQQNLLNDQIENPNDLERSTSFDAIGETGLSLVHKTHVDQQDGNYDPINFTAPNYKTLIEFNEKIVCCFAYIVDVKKGLTKHGFVGTVKQNLSDKTIIFEGVGLTSSPVTILEKLCPVTGTTISQEQIQNIEISDQKMFDHTFSPQYGFPGRFHLEEVQPIGLRFLAEAPLTTTVAIHSEIHFSGNYVSPHSNKASLDNLVKKKQTEVLLEKKANNALNNSQQNVSRQQQLNQASMNPANNNQIGLVNTGSGNLRGNFGTGQGGPGSGGSGGEVP